VEEYERRFERIRSSRGDNMEACGRVHLMGTRMLHIEGCGVSMKAERLKEETVRCSAVRLRSLNRENWHPLGDTYIKRNVIPVPAITNPIQEEIGFGTFSESTRVLR
jgi:hypothetical protein